jgi:uncharacterized damage-inducible protein DinB
MKLHASVVFASLVLFPLTQGQAPRSTGQANPLVAGTRYWYEAVKRYVTKSADLISEKDYGFKPTPEVRSFGQLVAHIADSNYLICSGAKGEKNPRKATDEIEKTMTAKADLVRALRESFAYCDGAYDVLTDAAAAQMVPFGAGQQPKLTILAFDTAHTFEHYGNMVTYMRLKGIVPPSTAENSRSAD